MEMKYKLRPGRTLNIDVHKNPHAKATAFLIHGLGGRSEQWRAQIPLLKNEYNLIIPDLFGLGKSDKIPNTNRPYTFLSMLADLQALFERFSADKNILLGHSYGGALATTLTMHHQNKIEKLILIDPTVCAPQSGMPMIFHLPSFVLSLMRPLLEMQFQRLAFASTTNAALLKEEATANKANRMYIIKAMIQEMKNTPYLNVSQLETPTLIILGEEDQVIPLKQVQHFYQAIPQHQFCFVPQAGHMPMLEQPSKVNQAIAAFLQDNL